MVDDLDSETEVKIGFSQKYRLFTDNNMKKFCNFLLFFYSAAKKLLI